MGLQSDIDLGLFLTSEISRLTLELKAVKERITTAALNGKQIPLEDAERDGMQFLAKGTEKIVPVIITADYLAASFAQDSKVHRSIVAALPNREPMLTEFYKPKLSFERTIEDGKNFRRAARDILGGEIAEPFIAACVVRDKDGIPKNATKIEWDRARPIEGKVVTA